MRVVRARCSVRGSEAEAGGPLCWRTAWARLRQSSADSMRGRALSAVALRIREAPDAGLKTEALDLARRVGPHGAPAAEFPSLGALAPSRVGAIGQAEERLARIDRSGPGDAALAGSFSVAFGAKSARLNRTPPSRCACQDLSNSRPVRPTVRQPAACGDEVEPAFALQAAGDSHAAARHHSRPRCSGEPSAPRGDGGRMITAPRRAAIPHAAKPPTRRDTRGRSCTRG